MKGILDTMLVVIHQLNVIQKLEVMSTACFLSLEHLC